MTCEHCAELEERVAQLEASLYGDEWQPPLEFGLTAHEAAILRALVVRNRVVPQWLLFDATRHVQNIRKDEVDERIVQIRICTIRKKLRPFGLSIETIYALGYVVTAETRHRLLNWKSDARAA